MPRGRDSSFFDADQRYAKEFHNHQNEANSGIIDRTERRFIVGAGETLNYGDAVYIDTATGHIKLASAANYATAKLFIGVIAENQTFTAGMEALVRWAGKLEDGLSGFTQGDQVWLSTAGTTGNTLTNTPPTGDDEAQLLVGLAVTATELKIGQGDILEV